MADVTEVTVNDDGTKTEIERDYTAEEAAQRATDAEASRLVASAAAVAEAERLAATAAALAHARSLGFTDEMIAVMYPGLVEAAISPTEPEPTPEGRGDLEVPKTVDNTVTLDTVES